MKTFVIHLWKALGFELKYLLHKLQFYKSLLLIVSFLQVFIISLGDVNAFFTGSNSLIPASWSFFKNPQNAQIISVILIIVIYLIVWMADSIQKSKEVSDLGLTVKNFVVPTVERELNSFINKTLKSKYSLSKNVRASIFLPVRVGIFQWRIQMICKTKNVPDKELDALFQMNEGVLGYMFVRAKKCYVDVINLADKQSIPSDYVPLGQDNNNLIEKDIKAVTVLVFSQGSSITGLLAVDTTDNSDISALEDSDLHSDVTDWMRSNRQAVELLWRMLNNV